MIEQIGAGQSAAVQAVQNTAGAQEAAKTEPKVAAPTTGHEGQSVPKSESVGNKVDKSA